MKTTRPLPAILVTLAGAAVMLGACSNRGDDDGVPQSDAPALNRALSTEPESLDPQKSRSVQAADVLRDIGEGLVSYDAAGEMIPATAESWDISEDGLTYTFRIRPEARWSNGDPVTAADFVFGLRRLVDPDTAAFYAAELGNVVNAAGIVAGKLEPGELGVSAPDDRTLVISLVRPTPYLLSLLTHPSTFPVHRGSVRQHGDAFVRAGNLLSNGAYVLADWEPGAMIELHRNEHYWNDAETSVDLVFHHVVTQEMAEFNRYRAGELHVTSTVPPENFDQIRADYPDELHVAPTLGVYYYGFNMTKPPFADNPELRGLQLGSARHRQLRAGAVAVRGTESAGTQCDRAESLPQGGLQQRQPPAFRAALQHIGYAAKNRVGGTGDVAQSAGRGGTDGQRGVPGAARPDAGARGHPGLPFELVRRLQRRQHLPRHHAERQRREHAGLFEP
jgi:oligopeptide transport system substrate-binding protein